MSPAGPAAPVQGEAIHKTPAKKQVSRQESIVDAMFVTTFQTFPIRLFRYLPVFVSFFLQSFSSKVRMKAIHIDFV